MPASDRRTDLSKGVFETLLVVDGRAVEREAHLRRLARSLGALYAAELPPSAEQRVDDAATDLALGRLRLTALPGSPAVAHTHPASRRGPRPGGRTPYLRGAGIRLEVDAGAVDPDLVFPRRGVRLRSRPLPGGLGPHKLANRPPVERPAPQEAGALILDGDEALEAGWANLFAVRQETLWTPPLDGRILPGTTRAALLALAAEAGIATREDHLHPQDLLAADEVFLSGSIRGIEPALELDGQPLAGRGPLSNRLAAALRRRWDLPDAAGALPALATAPPPAPPGP